MNTHIEFQINSFNWAFVQHFPSSYFKSAPGFHLAPSLHYFKFHPKRTRLRFMEYWIFVQRELMSVKKLICIALIIFSLFV